MKGRGEEEKVPKKKRKLRPKRDKENKSTKNIKKVKNCQQGSIIIYLITKEKCNIYMKNN